jgi:dipeptidyl aminopeptidase/acylaminoacyl peptidase
MCLLALRDGFPVRAAAVYGAITDLPAYLSSDPGAAALAERIWPDFKTRREEILRDRSALRWPERISAPLLLMHGGADPQVSPAHTLNLALRLQELHKEYAVVIFAGDSHILTKNRIDRDAQAARWFKSHIVE